MQRVNRRGKEGRLEGRHVPEPALIPCEILGSDGFDHRMDIRDLGKKISGDTLGGCGRAMSIAPATSIALAFSIGAELSRKESPRWKKVMCGGDSLHIIPPPSLSSSIATRQHTGPALTNDRIQKT